MATAQAVPKYELREVEIDGIKVEDGFNARTEFDAENLDARTSASPRPSGCGRPPTATSRSSPASAATAEQRPRA